MFAFFIMSKQLKLGCNTNDRKVYFSVAFSTPETQTRFAKSAI